MNRHEYHTQEADRRRMEAQGIAEAMLQQQLNSFSTPAVLGDDPLHTMMRNAGVQVRRPEGPIILRQPEVVAHEPQASVENLIKALQEDFNWIKDPRRISTKILRDKKLKEIANSC